MSDYSPAIAQLAAADHLFVVSDFDGTLADFSTDIYDVPVIEDSITALEQLSGLPRTTVAVLSGRHLEGLRQVCPLGDKVILGGSHGAESNDASADVSAEQEAHLKYIDGELDKICQRFPGASVERKPLHRVLHFLEMQHRDPEFVADAIAAAEDIDTRGFPRTRGKGVVEFAASDATKGSWIREQRARIGATAVVFLGDDVTDETGFAALDEPLDISVKVGEGTTAARLRLADTEQVAQFLGQLARAREAATNA